jgi:purine-binding chemotaxis protein CheW
MRSIPLAQITNTLPTLNGMRPEYLKGVTEEPLIILDGGRILADSKLIVNEEVSA